jgi:DNA-binding NarL/FixJ family response regulator
MLVLIAYRNLIFRRGLVALFEETGDIEIVGQTTEPEQMLAIVRAQNPDVVLFDGSISSHHPAYTATELVSLLYQAGARGIIVFAPDSSPIDEEVFFAFFKGGASAIESPNLPGEVLIEHIRRVSAGEHLITSEALQRPGVLLVALQELRMASSACLDEPQESAQGKNELGLSQRELEVLDHVKRGCSNKIVAQKMKISDQTVKNHISSILKKTKCLDRTAAVVLALRHGLLSFEDTGNTHETGFLPGDRCPANQSISFCLANDIPTQERSVPLPSLSRAKEGIYAQPRQSSH